MYVILAFNLPWFK